MLVLVRLVSVRFEVQKASLVQQEVMVLAIGCSRHIQKSGSQGCMQLATWQTIEGADQILYRLDDDHARTRLAKKMKNTKNIRGNRHAILSHYNNAQIQRIERKTAD